MDTEMTEEPLGVKAAGSAEQGPDLPLVMDGQVPLKLVVERLVYQSFAELQNLTEILPSMSDIPRKKTLLNHFLQVRKQFTKLLVLVRWSRHAGDVQKCLNIIGFLQSQNGQFEATIASLAQVRDSLKLARIRNYDLPSAIDVLTTGKYLRLPTKIKSDYVPEESLSPDDIIRTLGDIDDSIRLRLLLHDLVPQSMKLFQISDGRAKFAVADVFEVALTIGGIGNDQQWYILDFKFLLHEAENGKDSVETPSHIRDQMIEIGNTLLSIAPEDNPHADTPPLFRLYNFCHRFTLSYQLELLSMQAFRLARTRWSEQLKVDYNQSKQTLKLTYWSHPVVSSTQTSRSRQQPQGASTAFSHQNFVEIALVEEVLTNPVDAILNKSLTHNGHDFPRQECLAIDWSWTKEGSKVEDKTLMQLSLDVESILEYVTRSHANQLVMQFSTLISLQPKRNVLSSDDVQVVNQQQYTSAGVIKIILVRLHTSNLLRINVDHRRGRLLMRQAGNTGGISVALRAAEERINDNSLNLIETLQRLKFTMIMDEIESKAAYLGYAVARRMAVRNTELAKFGSTTRYLLYLAVPGHTDHHIVFALTDQGFRYHLVQLNQVSEGAVTWYVIAMMLPLDWVATSLLIASAASQTLRKRKRSGAGDLDVASVAGKLTVDAQMIKKLVSYCQAYIAYQHLQLQLDALFIPQTFAPMAQDISSIARVVLQQTNLETPIGVSLPSLTDLRPATVERLSLVQSYLSPLRIDADSLTAGGGDFADRNVYVRVIPDTQRVLIQTKLRVTPGADNASCVRLDGSGVVLDPKTSVITFEYEEARDCITKFLGDWSKIAKVARLASQVESPDFPANTGVKLVSFDLRTLVLAYGPEFNYQLAIEYGADEDDGDKGAALGGYSLTLSAKKDENPHHAAAYYLECILNQQDSLRVLAGGLYDTMPLYAQLAEVEYPRPRQESDKPATSTSRSRVDVIPRSLTFVRILYTLELDASATTEKGEMYAFDVRLCAPHVYYLVDASRAHFETSTSNGKAEKAAVKLEAEVLATMVDEMVELPSREYHPIKCLDMAVQSIVNDFHVAPPKAIKATPNTHGRQFSTGGTPTLNSKPTMTPPNSSSPSTGKPTPSSTPALTSTPKRGGAPMNTNEAGTTSDNKNRLTTQIEQAIVVPLSRGLVCHRSVIGQVVERLDVAIKADLAAM